MLSQNTLSLANPSTPSNALSLELRLKLFLVLEIPTLGLEVPTFEELKL
jgi:hypothetical protein